MQHIAGPDAFRAAFGVSRETIARLERYAQLLARWNRRINLVAASTLPDMWHRHFADSAQLWPLRPQGARIWTDIGSGAGFPGLVLATLAVQEPGPEFTLIEADARKAAFLQAVIRELDLPARIVPERIEDAELPPSEIVSARALAPLTKLILYTGKCRQPKGTALFPKGETVHKELSEAQRHWRFEHKLHASLTEPKAAVVEIGAVHGPRR